MLWQSIRWGESSQALLRQFGNRATRLPWPLDFGDSYVEVVLRNERVGGYRVVVFFQMGKRSHGLKRIQIERPRHGVNPPAHRAMLAALAAAYGPADAVCDAPPSRSNGYQAAAERLWLRDGNVIRAIYRDTTIEAVEGCLGEAAPPCGLTGQLLLRISPADGAVARCSLSPAS